MQRKILVADDSPTIRRLVTQTFADENYKIIEVNNGDAAIKAVEESRPQIVLADIYMPGKNGYQVCEYIRAHAQLGQTPVILLVGAFDAFDEEAAQRAGATAHIKKPFEPAALTELVHSLIPAESAESQPESSAGTEAAAEASGGPPEPDSDDLLGLATIFKEEPAAPAAALSEEDIERIADRVIAKVSTQIVESIAWDVVPDITERILREELKRNR
jgi:CheY-like chemotaxis protein